MKKVDYSETIAACDLKLIDLMKIPGVPEYMIHFEILIIFDLT